MRQIRDIEEQIGYEFRDKELLLTALTHSSFASENQIDYALCNERLEFLGDAILELVVRDFLYEKFPQLGEDKLTEKKKSLTHQRFLAHLARQIGLDRLVRLGRGEAASGGDEKDSIMANVLEALLGAVYLDQGLSAARAFFFAHVPGDAIAAPAFDDPKSELNTWATTHQHTIIYRITREEGAPHQRLFYVEVVIDDQTIGSGEGRSKKMAEQDAARKALAQLLEDT
jgi:ribonuclease-3